MAADAGFIKTRCAIRASSLPLSVKSRARILLNIPTSQNADKGRHRHHTGMACRRPKHLFETVRLISGDRSFRLRGRIR